MGIIHQSTFTAPDGTELDDYTPEIGNPWTQFSLDNWTIQGNQLQLTANQSAPVYVRTESGVSVGFTISASISLPASPSAFGFRLCYNSSPLRYIDCVRRVGDAYISHSVDGTIDSTALSQLSGNTTYEISATVTDTQVFFTIDADNLSGSYTTAIPITDSIHSLQAGARSSGNAFVWFDDVVIEADGVEPFSANAVLLNQQTGGFSADVIVQSEAQNQIFGNAIVKGLNSFNTSAYAYITRGFPLDQSRYRWRNDDDDESAATWKAVEGTPVVSPPDTNVRLRIQVDTLFGNPDPADFRLEYRLAGSSDPWLPVIGGTPLLIPGPYEVGSEYWDDWAAHLNNIISQNTLGTESTSTIGSLSEANQWWGGVLAENGKIYAAPHNATAVLKIDPDTDTVTSFDSFATGFKWAGSVLAPNGKIYGIPRTATTVLKIDPDTDTTSEFGTLSGSDKWVGGVLAPNGMIYGVPFASTTVLKIDPTNDTVSTFGSLGGFGAKWMGGVLAPNDMIYCIAHGEDETNSSKVLKIDPSNDTAIRIGTNLGISPASKWIGGVLAPNGKIYGIPFDSTTVLKIDPDTDTVSTFGSLSSSTWKWAGAVLAPNGYIYCMSENASTVLRINPTNDTVTEILSLSGTLKWFGGVLAPSGAIYGIPRNSTTVLKLDPDITTPFHENVSLSGHWNIL